LFNRSIEVLLQDGVRTGEFVVENESVVTHAISGMATWIFTWYRPDGPLSPNEIAQQMANLVLRMVQRETGRDIAKTMVFQSFELPDLGESDGG
jgi:hypothetical protein